MDHSPVSIKSVLSITSEISLIYSVCIGSRNEIAIGLTLGLPRWLNGNEPAWQCRRGASVTGWEDPLEKEMATQSSCLGNPMDREAWRAIVHGGAKESDMTEPLNNKQQVLPLSESNPTALCCLRELALFVAVIGRCSRNLIYLLLNVNPKHVTK